MLVLDANILIRAVLGTRVLWLLRTYSTTTHFLAPDVAFADAHEKLPEILQKRGVPEAPALRTLELITSLVQIAGPDIYSGFEASARQRLDRRDADDWPILATALALNCPIWTEDTDFFGCGVATWTTDRIQFFLDA